MEELRQSLESGGASKELVRSVDVEDGEGDGADVSWDFSWGA